MTYLILFFMYIQPNQHTTTIKKQGRETACLQKDRGTKVARLLIASYNPSIVHTQRLLCCNNALCPTATINLKTQ